MSYFYFDEKKIFFQEGESIIDAIKKANIYIPSLCYHPGLPVEQRCRLCLVENDETGEVFAACSVKCQSNLILRRETSARVIDAVDSTLRFLIENHPADCTICSKSGDCDLQELAEKSAHSPRNINAFLLTKDKKINSDIHVNLRFNLNNCINCGLCIGFAKVILNSKDFVEERIGNFFEITKSSKLPMTSPYSGCLEDICPSGAIISRNRPSASNWTLERKEGICFGCSTGCNVNYWLNKNSIEKITPRQNSEINKWWMCDKGRSSHVFSKKYQRILEPMMKNESELKKCTWNDIFKEIQYKLSHKKVALVLSPDISNESLETIIGNVSLNHRVYWFNPYLSNLREDKALDNLLIRQDQTPNNKKFLDFNVQNFQDIKINEFSVLIFINSGIVRPPYGLNKIDQIVYGIGEFQIFDVFNFDAILPIKNIFENDGTYQNYQNKTQKQLRIKNLNSYLPEPSELFQTLFAEIEGDLFH